MDSDDDFIKKHSNIIVLIVIILTCGIPCIINVLFKLHPSNKFFIAEWSAGEILSYYGSILLGAVTIYLAYVSITQTKYANKVNEKLLNMEQIDKKAYLKINLKNSRIEKLDNDVKCLFLEFENITDNIVVDFNIETSEKLLINTTWEKDRKSESGSVVTKLEVITSNNLIKDGEKLDGRIQIKDLSKAMLIAFKVKIKSIYGLETIQYFNIMLIKGEFNTYKTLV